MPIDVIGFAVAKVEADKRNLPPEEANRIGVVGAVMPTPLMSLVVARSMADRAAPATPSPPQDVPVINLVPPKQTGTGTTGTGTTGTGTPGTGTPGTDTPGTGTPGTGTPGTGTPSTGTPGTGTPTASSGTGSTVTIPVVGGGSVILTVDPSVFRGVEDATKEFSQQMQATKASVEEAKAAAVDAKSSADQAKALAQENKDALSSLRQTVTDGFNEIKARLPAPPPTSTGTSGPATPGPSYQQSAAKAKGGGGAKGGGTT